MVRRMFEYASVSASAYDVNALVGKLNDKASDGWEVVSIVPTGGDVTAFLRRTASATTDGEGADTGAETAAIVEAVAVSEPAGWAAEPSTSDAAPATGSEWAPVTPPREDVTTASTPPVVSEPEPVSTSVADTTAPSEPEPAAAAAPTTSSVPTTPAGWYPDPSGRYEMRYWDGDKWTEHVSRQGQTYTDPPVA
jgi:hypothetical protein